MTIRAEEPRDATAVRRVHARAFGRVAEAELVEALRAGDGRSLSLVATVADAVVGHVLLSPVAIDAGAGGSTALALGPVGVLPEHQRCGLGAALVRAALAQARLDEGVVFVLGDPDFYRRFGFTPAAPLGLRCIYPAPPDAFMVVELRAGALAGRRGLVRYHPAFDRV